MLTHSLLERIDLLGIKITKNEMKMVGLTAILEIILEMLGNTPIIAITRYDLENLCLARMRDRDPILVIRVGPVGRSVVL
jgi:hypothetical protein